MEFLDTPFTAWFGVILGGAAAGAMNALAGGGTFFSFPALLAAGLPPVTANATNAVALWPASLAGAWAARASLRPLGRYLIPLLLAGLAGGLLQSGAQIRIGQKRARGCRVACSIVGHQGIDARPQIRPIANAVANDHRASKRHRLEGWQIEAFRIVGKGEDNLRAYHGTQVFGPRQPAIGQQHIAVRGQQVGDPAAE